MEKGVPENEIAFIHDANTELRKAELFAKVRSGQVRFLLGSTAKMGAGTNVQDRLIALHHWMCLGDLLTLNSRREESYDRATRMIRSRYFVMLRKVHLTVTRGSSLRISRNSSDRL